MDEIIERLWSMSCAQGRLEVGVGMEGVKRDLHKFVSESPIVLSKDVSFHRSVVLEIKIQIPDQSFWSESTREDIIHMFHLLLNESR